MQFAAPLNLAPSWPFLRGSQVGGKFFYLDSIPNISNLVTDWGPDLPYSPCVNLLRPWQAPRCFHCENSASRLCSAAILGTRRGYVPACKDYSFGNSNNRIVCPLPFVPVSRLNNHNFNTTCSDLDTFLRRCASCTFRWKYLLISSSTIFHGCLLIIFNWVFPATPLLQRSKSVQIRHVLVKQLAWLLSLDWMLKLLKVFKQLSKGWTYNLQGYALSSTSSKVSKEITNHVTIMSWCLGGSMVALKTQGLSKSLIFITFIGSLVWNQTWNAQRGTRHVWPWTQWTLGATLGAVLLCGLRLIGGFPWLSGKGGTLDEHWMNMDEHILSSVKETTSSMQYLKYESFNRTLRSTYQAFFCDRFNHFRSIASPFDSFYCVPSRTACPASTQTFGSKLGQLGPSTHPLCKLWSFWCKGPQPSSANLRIGELTQNFSPSIAWASPRRLIMWSIFQRNAKIRVNQVN